MVCALDWEYLPLLVVIAFQVLVQEFHQESVWVDLLNVDGYVNFDVEIQTWDV